MSKLKDIYQLFDTFTDNVKEKIRVKGKFIAEKNKFKDSRRINIAGTFPLTKEQKQQIDDLYIKHFGQKINYIYHQNYAAHANKFDYRFFPEIYYTTEFESYLNWNKDAVTIFSDKNLLPLIASSVGVKMPRTIISCTNGILRDSFNKIISSNSANCILTKGKEYFIKPTVDTGSGRNCLKTNLEDKLLIENSTLTINKWITYKDNYVIQDVLTQHNSLSDIYPNSINTFRIISYIWKGRIEIMPVILRIGQGGNYLDNAHAGGMFIAVNNQGLLCDHASTEFNEKFTFHPDTHLVFLNHKVENYPSLIDSVTTMHSAIPQLGVVNWDFTINQDGEPILLEANCKDGGIWVIQMAHGVGPFGDKTEEVLEWLRFMRKLPYSKWKNYQGGIFD